MNRLASKYIRERALNFKKSKFSAPDIHKSLKKSGIIVGGSTCWLTLDRMTAEGVLESLGTRAGNRREVFFRKKSHPPIEDTKADETTSQENTVQPQTYSSIELGESIIDLVNELKSVRSAQALRITELKNHLKSKDEYIDQLESDIRANLETIGRLKTPKQRSLSL